MAFLLETLDVNRVDFRDLTGDVVMFYTCECQVLE